MRILADHCVPSDVIALLRADGHDVVRVVDVADPRLPDRDVAALAQRQNAVLLTNDADFSKRRDFDPKRFPGIVLLRDLEGAADRVYRRARRLFARHAAADLAGRLIILDRRSARARR